MQTGEADNLKLIKLENRNGFKVELLNLGATLARVSAPDRDGGHADLILGYDSPEEYLKDRFYFGSTPGRYANRIGGAQFYLDGVRYELTRNEGRNQLHGGETGFAKRIWQVSMEGGAAVFTYTSADGENGYPGALTARVAYSLNDDNEITIGYSAVSDADTVVNLTNHAYFNLDGCEGNILGHRLWLNADSFLETDEENIPTGEMSRTSGGPLDFSSPIRIRDAIGVDEADENCDGDAGGVDSCFVLNAEGAKGLRRAAVLTGGRTGRTLEVDTDLPGLQVYTGHFIAGGTKGAGGREYGPYSGVCLEAQNFPDAPNHPEFPSAVLKKGEEFKAAVIYRFTC